MREVAGSVPALLSGVRVVDLVRDTNSCVQFCG